MQQTTDGGYVVAGYTESYGAGSYDVWLIKTDSDGNELWSKTYGGTDNDEAYSVKQTTDGGYIVAGYTESYGAGEEDMWLIKTDADGNKLWDQTFGGNYYDSANSVQQTNDNGYIVAGYTYFYGAHNHDAWLIKTDTDGNMLWDQTYGGTGLSDKAESVQQTTDGGYIIAGFTDSYGTDTAWLIKTDADGNMLWDRTYGGGGFSDDYAESVQQTTDGGYIVAGYAGSNPGERDVWLIKTDADGNAPLP